MAACTWLHASLASVATILKIIPMYMRCAYSLSWDLKHLPVAATRTRLRFIRFQPMNGLVKKMDDTVTERHEFI